MATSTLRYDLVDGYIHNWLVAGPRFIPANGLEEADAGVVRQKLADLHASDPLGVVETPVERGPLSEGTFTMDDFEGAWFYLRCREDHYVDLSAHYVTGGYVRGWAYAQVILPDDEDLSVVLMSSGPTDLWVNGQHSGRLDAAGRLAVPVAFSAGANELLVRFDAFGARNTMHMLAMRLIDLSSEQAGVALPTTIEPLDLRETYERIFNGAYLKQAVYRSDERIEIHWDPAAGGWTREKFEIQLRRLDERILALAPIHEMPEEYATLGYPRSYPEDRYHALLIPELKDYAERNMRFSRALPFWGLDNNEYSEAFYATLVERRGEALKDSARYRDDVYAEMAKMAIGWWSTVEMPVIKRAMATVAAREAGSVGVLLGLLGILLRFGEDPQFPEMLREPLEDTIAGYRYAADEPGDDLLSFHDETDAFLFHTCEVLAGQHLPDRIFENVNETGVWHREMGEKRVLAWLRTHVAQGFAAWDSDMALEKALAALIHLEEFADSDEVWNLASAMLDKLLFAIALNSYKGVFGAARGVTTTGSVLNGALSPVSGISRLMWGMGAFNHHTMGLVSLACAEDYGFPRLLQAIGTALPGSLWDQEHHGASAEGGGVDKVLYRTPDYLLSAALDYRPGEVGDKEQVWQATLGPAAQVFVNHPASASVDDAVTPNFWRGNATLPRVAQWQDVLIAVHRLPKDDWMGFTHAYFPAHAFDAYAIRDGWAFAQKDDGYLAITASTGLSFAEVGLHANRELRARGSHCVWITHMGRAETDGSFEEFQDAILGLDVVFEELAVRIGTLRDETLAFGWDGAFLKDDEPVSLHGFNHYESAYGYAEFPAEELIVMYAGQAMKLDLT